MIYEKDADGKPIKTIHMFAGIIRNLLQFLNIRQFGRAENVY